MSNPPPIDPKSPSFASHSATLKMQSRSPAFKKFCSDELPPLSPSIPHRPRFTSKTTPGKQPTNSNLLSEEVLDIETIIEKTKEINNRDLFQKFLNDGDGLSPFMKKRCTESVPHQNINSERHIPHLEKFIRPMNIHVNGIHNNNNNYNNNNNNNSNNNNNNGNNKHNITNFNIRLGSINRLDFKKSLQPLTTQIKPIVQAMNQQPNFHVSPPKNNQPPLLKNIVSEKKVEIDYIKEEEDTKKTTEKPIEKELLESSFGRESSKQRSPSNSGNTGKNSVTPGCKCKKSKCLKLYCECFSAKMLCKESCACFECANNSEGVNSQKEREKKIEEANNEEKGQKKGCNCKKSHCLKRYCECFEAKLKCDTLCKCEDCKNVEEDPKKGKRKPYEEAEKLLKKRKV